MAQNSSETKPATAEDTSTSVTSKTGEQPTESQSRPVFTILRPNAGSSSASTPTGSITPQRTSEGMASHEQDLDQSAGLTKSLEALEVDDDSNDTEDTALDEFLVNALKNRQDRIFLLKLDREFCSFLNNPNQEQLEFPSLNSYYRMVIHRVANYFKITRVVDPQQKKIILFKTEQSAIPALRFSDLVEEEQEQPVKPMKLLKRNPNRPSSGVSTPEGSSEPDRKTISIKEREEAYAKARARIFQEDVPVKQKSESSGSNSRSDSPSVSMTTSESSRQDVGEEGTRLKGGRKQNNGKKSVSGSTQSPEELGEGEYRQYNHSSPSSRNVSRSASPSPVATGGGPDMNPRMTAKGLGPKTKLSKGDLSAECADTRRRKSTTSNASSSSGTVRTPVGLARTISSSSSQDGFQSPHLGSTMTESPAYSSPSNANTPKAYDYFGQNPTPGSGSVSPMSSGSSRSSFSYPQQGGLKQHRNPHGGGGGAGYHSGNHSHQPSNSGFMKGMSASTFVPKKPYPKHGNNHNGGNNGAFNNGSGAFPPGASSQGPTFNNTNNGTSSPYTHPQLSTSSPWPERGMLPGHEPSAIYNSPQDQNPTFPYGSTLTQYPQSGPHLHQQPFSNNNHNVPHNHPNSNQHNIQSASNRGGRRNPSSKQYGHQPHFQHPHHARTHPQMHPSQYHHGNTGQNYNGPLSRDDFVFSQVSQTVPRYGRPFDGNHSQGPPQQYGSDFYPPHGMPGDHQGVSSMYPAFVGQQLTTSPGENSPNGSRFPYSQHWNQGQSPGSQGGDPSSMMYNPISQPPMMGKKSFNGYQHNGSMSHPAPLMMPPPPHSHGLVPGQTPHMMMGGTGNSSGAGHGVYDVERRPPKSAELFDPNGPSSFNNGGNGQGDYSVGGRHQGFHDGGPDGGQAMGMMMMGGSERLPHGPNQYPHPSVGHHGPSPFNSSMNYQQQFPQLLNVVQHQNQNHQAHQQQQHPSHQPHVPVGMNRSYSSSSSTGYGGGTGVSSSNANSSNNNANGSSSSNSSSGGPQHHNSSNGGSKKNHLLYDYSVLATPAYDGVAKSTSPETEKSAPSLSHILEIHDFDTQDDIFQHLVLPAGSKLRRLKPTSGRDGMVGQCLVVFKNALLASEALLAFQEGKVTWMAPEAPTQFEAAEAKDDDGEGDEKEEEGQGAAGGRTRIQRRFNVRIWTPVLVNSTTPTATMASAPSLAKVQSSPGVSTVVSTATEATTPVAGGACDSDGGARDFSCSHDKADGPIESPRSPGEEE
ncbi:R3H domain-containing protein 2 [Mortierella claussenii]|nr:R3H domain-containing protein 2 [Mortierella claussenii]